MIDSYPLLQVNWSSEQRVRVSSCLRGSRLLSHSGFITVQLKRPTGYWSGPAPLSVRKA